MVWRDWPQIQDGLRVEASLGSQRTRVWSAMDFSDDPELQTLAARFPSPEVATLFQNTMTGCKQVQGLHAPPFLPALDETLQGDGQALSPHTTLTALTFMI